jgi:hypothetical protein
MRKEPGSVELSRVANPERVEDPIKAMREAIRLRDAREAELLQLLSKSSTTEEESQKAWFEWRLTCGDLEKLIENEIKSRMEK